MHHNCMRIGFEVRACTASRPHIIKNKSFHKLIHVIRIFMRKTFGVQCHPRNIFNIELFQNYGILLHYCNTGRVNRRKVLIFIGTNN